MLKYVVKRLLLAILILFGVSIIIYFLVRLLPNDYFDQTYASQLAQGTITAAEVDAIRASYGLADKSFMGLVSGYFSWLGHIFIGDLGTSLKYQQPVAQVISENMGISFGISFVAMLLQYLIAIPLGIKAATNQYGKVDYTVTVLTMMGISLPTFFFGALMIQLFAINLGWFPVSGLVDASMSVDASAFTRLVDMMWHLFLPMLTLVILSLGSLMRYTRTNMLEVLNADYIRTARAKGLSESSVVYKHAFKNTMIPIVTMMAGIIPSLFGGAMITEQVFNIPGIGQMAYQATKVGDIPFVMGYNMFLAILTVLGTLLSDLMYAVVDPRVKIAK